jgi:hypothetical protein
MATRNADEARVAPMVDLMDSALGRNLVSLVIKMFYV